ncbi:MAG: NYN domain-containing protein [Deltaproteobacteria bacterium]|jgi:uncharacterized LabA/DUF88 family protein|nr:NYN domain-containing protein [Deltaproteobacteria bacterium]
MSSSSNGAVLLIDVENVIGLCNNLKSEGVLEDIDIKPVCDKLTEMFGPLRCRKSYGDIAYSCSKTANHHWIRAIRKNFYDNLIEINDIPNFGGYKNMADMTIITEALSIAFDNEDISVFAIFSSDADYVPLYTKLKERGKTVVIIGVTQEATSSILTKAADYLFYYQNLVSQTSFSSAAQPVSGHYSHLVLRAAESIVDQGAPLQGSALLHKIRQLQSDFDYKQLGFKKFIDFLKDVELRTNALSVNPHPEFSGDMTITLNDTLLGGASQHKTPPEPQTPKEHVPLTLPEEYKAVLERKLRCPLLTNAQYERCCEAIFNIFTKEVLENPAEDADIKLVELKNLVMQELLSDPLFAAITSNGRSTDPFDSVLFKLLKALYMTGVFCKPKKKADEPVLDLFNNNPVISVFYKKKPNLMERLYYSMFYVLKSYDLPLDKNALSQLFFGNEDKDNVKHMGKLVDSFDLQTMPQNIARENAAAHKEAAKEASVPARIVSLPPKITSEPAKIIALPPKIAAEPAKIIAVAANDDAAPAKENPAPAATKALAAKAPATKAATKTKAAAAKATEESGADEETAAAAILENRKKKTPRGALSV